MNGRVDMALTSSVLEGVISPKHSRALPLNHL
jgi:hypothetical protein